MVLGFHDPVSAQVGGEFGRFRLVGVEAGDRVDGLAGLLPADCFAAAVDAEGELRVGEGDAAEVVGDGESLDRGGLATAVSLVRGEQTNKQIRRGVHKTVHALEKDIRA
ncbi:hypothetical protein ACWGJX_47990, partial [Streptomyces sp. NPDC054775]